MKAVECYLAYSILSLSEAKVSVALQIIDVNVELYLGFPTNKCGTLELLHVFSVVYEAGPCCPM